MTNPPPKVLWKDKMLVKALNRFLTLHQQPKAELAVARFRVRAETGRKT